MKIGVTPSFLGSFGFSTFDTRNLTMSICPSCDATKIGVTPSFLGSFGFSTFVERNLTMSICPSCDAM